MKINILTVILLVLLINSSLYNCKTVGNRSRLAKLLKPDNSSLNETEAKLLNKRNSGSSASFLFDVVKKDLIEGLQSVQSSMSERDLECMPGSLFYNGSCIFISSKRQKLSWIHSERFCRKLPLNTTYLILQNNHKYEFLRKEIIKLREKENPVDQLVFFVGFRYLKNQWRWTNNQTLTSSNLTLGKYWWDWSGSHGDCGSIALLKNNELIMRSAPCLSTSTRFMCEYSLNPCYKNDICGPRGKCVNLYYKFYCDCSVSMFYEGKYCEKFNSRGIQAIVGLAIVIFLVISIFCNSSFVNKIWHYYFGKDIIRDKMRSEEAKVEFTETKSQKSKNLRSLSMTLRSNFKKLFTFENIVKNFSYFILSFLTIVLVIIQIIFAHNIYEFEFVKQTKKSKIVQHTCNFLEDYYMFEDLIYLPFSLLFLLILYIFLNSRRFNKYIMVKFKNYFKSDVFKSIQKEYKEKHEQMVKQKEDELLKKPCGNCRSLLYKCCTQNFCKCFCCLFCCSCCVPPGSNTSCFIWYCCCLGWRQTDFYKVLKTIGKFFKCFFYTIFCCPIWIRLWNLTKEKRKEKDKQKKKLEKRKKDNDNDTESTSIDQDDDFDENDYDIDTQNMSRQPCPFPSMPFSTTNRAQSAAVYIIYTYDVLNIFMFVYTANVATTYIPFIGNVSQTSGILVELIIQFLQVIMIGIKFYPILVVADADPHLIIYFFSTIYMLFIWLSWFFKKAFCSRTEAFIRHAFEKISTDFTGRIKQSINIRRNVSNTVLGLFTDEDKPSEVYFNALKQKIPGVFKEFFGKYNPNDESQFSSEDLLLYGNNENMNNGLSSTLNNYYLLNPDFTTMAQTRLLTTPSYESSTSVGFRASLKNKTLTQLKDLKGFYRQREESFIALVNVFENLPLYVTLSYLLMRYGLLFLSSLVSFMRDKCSCQSKSRKSLDFENASLEKNLNDAGNAQVQSQGASRGIHLESERSRNEALSKVYDTMLSDLDKGYKEKNKITEEIFDKANHNYSYIKNLLSGMNLYSDGSKTGDSVTQSDIIHRIQTSFIWNLIETRIYKAVPYMRYSKQFVNTFTVAFMVVYFFTLFGFRLSNIFGNALVGTVEIFYKFVFRGLIPSFDLNEHNFNTEFRICCLLTSFLISLQLLSSIRSFHNDLVKLHKGEKFFKSLVLRYKNDEYSKIIKKRNKASSTITSDSLHFPGYLVAHVVYGYVILFLILFVLIVLTKILFYLPGAVQTLAQILLPLFILFSFKFIFIKYLIKSVFLREDNQRITNLAPYYIFSYFNFFFDCFLGLIACMSRVWQTTVISLIRLPRLDKSMFNSDDDLLMRRLDKGHLAYLNYVRMEHWYNNPVLNGFCEMLIESMLYSQIYRAKFELMASTSLIIRKENSLNRTNSSTAKLTMRRLISQKDGHRQYSVIERVVPVFAPSIRSISYNPATTTQVKKVNFERGFESDLEEDGSQDSMDDIINALPDLGVDNADDVNEMEEKLKSDNKIFKYSSFLRLRNTIYLCLLLRKNPSLKQYRHHYLEEVRRRDLKKKSNVQSSSEFFNEKLEKLKMKLNIKNRLQKMSRNGSRENQSTLTTNSNCEDEKQFNDNDSLTQSNQGNNDDNNNRPYFIKRYRKLSI